MRPRKTVAVVGREVSSGEALLFLRHEAPITTWAEWGVDASTQNPARFLVLYEMLGGSHTRNFKQVFVT